MLEQPHQLPGPVDETLPQFRDLTFLIVDDNPDGRFLVEKTLLRKFPNARIVGCQTLEAAARAFETHPASLIVSHRTFEQTGIELLRALRQLAPETPLIMTSGIDRSDVAITAGADAFHTYDEWLMIGNHAAQLLSDFAAKRSKVHCNGASKAEHLEATR